MQPSPTKQYPPLQTNGEETCRVMSRKGNVLDRFENASFANVGVSSVNNLSVGAVNAVLR